ncbi:hypothetical protein LX15_005795 [Streptoalloteichus tenebrarius]|uniref:Uncharacterized protein n=1 Tax=Streptoalloteichus tenebrarius (strain ATCC 17920 / DSM 40477 / JCM 4838 / CBS 697.72 / NBRC 16177 / NCIMB 11028 / NRRL B-12390 / A12253. 1 / ISP 5477) TaxID=1933 RepID=A0ABT1I2P5_STRSD|nr:hypothetical protein [Streptoalloteichus tenebrarius]MCP2262063.1 hypothetical protein [Streptoalloteichus tenebrarius]
MNVTDQAAIDAFPELRHLIALRNGGWRFLPPLVRDGLPVEVDGFREWPGGYRDVIGVRSPTDVTGLRVTGEDPPGIVWEFTGGLGEVVHALLALPAPGDRLAPRLVVASGPSLWTPTLGFGRPC